MPASSLLEETVLKTNWAHSSKVKIILEYSKKEIIKLCMPSGSLRCKNITNSVEGISPECAP